MATVEFDHSVKHRGIWYVPHAAIKAAEEELDKLIKMGAKVVEREQQQLQNDDKGEKPKVKKAVKNVPYKIPPASPSKEEAKKKE